MDTCLMIGFGFSLRNPEKLLIKTSTAFVGSGQKIKIPVRELLVQKIGKLCSSTCQVVPERLRKQFLFRGHKNRTLR